MNNPEMSVGLGLAIFAFRLKIDSREILQRMSNWRKNCCREERLKVQMREDVNKGNWRGRGG